jgi:hypothetical protein
MRGTLSHYAFLLFSKKEFERALVALALWNENSREIGRLVSVVRPSTLASRREEIIQISSLCSFVTEFAFIVAEIFI